jgi:type IV secretion system protein VirB11
VNAGFYLESYLAMLSPWLQSDDVTDILVNRPGEVWVEDIKGVTQKLPAPQITELELSRLARQIAASSHQAVNREQPLLSASLPNGARVQIIAPPATRGGLVLAVRKHRIADLSLDDLAASGLFEECRGVSAPRTRAAIPELAKLLRAGRTLEFLKSAVRHRQTVVISGGTSSGKTTLLNALVRQMDSAERLIVIEDAPEIRLKHENSVGLVAVRGDQGEARVDADDLLRAALRMRPDRILLGELRGREAFAFLRAVNSGHPGSITTVHADSPEGAVEQIALLAMTSGLDLGWQKICSYVEGVVDVIVQLERRAGVRRVSDIRFLPSARMDNLSESSRQTTFSPETVTLRVAAGAGPERS